MRRRFIAYKVFDFLLLIFFSVVLFSCGENTSKVGKLIFTQISAETVESSKIIDGDYKYSSGMQIVMANLSFKDKLGSLEVLSNDFTSARAPEVSFDGKRVVFSAQKSEGDIWQIWIIDLDNKEKFQVTDCKSNCTDPAWLPDGRIVFSKQVEENELVHHALFTIATDGCCEQRITFQPHDDLNATVLKDGRILVSSRQLYPENGPMKFLAMRPDGTKAELFYSAEYGRKLGEAVEDGNGNVLIPESGIFSAIKFSRPLHTKSLMTDKYQVSSFDNLKDYNLVVSLKKSGDAAFSLSMFNQEDLDKALFVYTDPENHLIEAVAITKKELPRKLPSRVNKELETGYFVCMDAEASEIELDMGNDITTKVQVLGINKMIGETAIAEDGSFYLELKADQPVRFQTVNASGDIVRGPSSWMWVRPNERRGCVGCHENSEIAPENVVPKAIEKAPVAMIK